MSSVRNSNWISSKHLTMSELPPEISRPAKMHSSIRKLVRYHASSAPMGWPVPANRSSDFHVATHSCICLSLMLAHSLYNFDKIARPLKPAGSRSSSPLEMKAVRPFLTNSGQGAPCSMELRSLAKMSKHLGLNTSKSPLATPSSPEALSAMA